MEDNAQVATRRDRSADPPEVIPLSPILREPLTRRGLLRFGFFSSLLLWLGGITAGLANFAYPRGVTGFGGPVFVPGSAIPAPGEPPRQNVEGHFLLVNLLPDEGRLASDAKASPGGLLALWWRCPHLGCTVPWKDSFVSPLDPQKRRGSFNCNCHGSTYTKSGALVRGPATRALDTMEIEYADGGIVVQTGNRRPGDNDNPRRALRYPAQT